MKTICKLMIVGALALAATPAAATTFVGAYNVNLNTSDAQGLPLNWAPITPLNFQLNTLNQSTSFNLFNLFTNEGNIDSNDDNQRPIAVNFTFTQPSSATGGVTGETSGETFGFAGYYQYGLVTWANSGNATFNFAGGTSLKVHLADAIFNGGQGWGLNEGAAYGAPINATFTLTGLGAGGGGAVPEPATWAMMIMGFGMVGAGLRLRRREGSALA